MLTDSGTSEQGIIMPRSPVFKTKQCEINKWIHLGPGASGLRDTVMRGGQKIDRKELQLPHQTIRHLATVPTKDKASRTVA